MTIPYGTSNHDVWYVHLRGMVCTCRPGCTVHRWADNPDTTLDEPCQPCNVMAGEPYVKPGK